MFRFGSKIHDLWQMKHSLRFGWGRRINEAGECDWEGGGTVIGMGYSMGNTYCSEIHSFFIQF